jgi:hypothetical protein
VIRKVTLVVWIRNGGRRIARGKRVRYGAVESGLTVMGFFFDGVLVVSVHRRSYPVHADMSCSARPCDREEKRALFECFDVMRHAAIEREQTAGAKAEGSP